MCYNICCKGCCGVRITKEPEVRKQEILDAAMRLFGLFVDSTAAAAIVSTYFMTVSVGYILNTVTNCFLGVLNGMGKPARSMLFDDFLLYHCPYAVGISAFGRRTKRNMGSGVCQPYLRGCVISACGAGFPCAHNKKQRALTLCFYLQPSVYGLRLQKYKNHRRDKEKHGERRCHL